MRDKEELERRGEEEQLMDEKKKKKDDKKKEALLKKATEQKPKVPEPTKSGPGPPQPSIPGAPSTTAGCGVASNGGSKRSGAANGGCGGQGQALPPQAQLSATLGQQGPTTGGRYPPREVPPRFRQQEQKQLLKRGHLLSGITPQASASPALLGASCVSAVQLSSTQSSSLPPAPNKTDIGQQAVVNGLDEDCWLGGTGGVEKIAMGTGHLDVDTTGSLEARCQGKRAVGPASNHCAGNGVGANQSIGTSGMAGLASSGTGQHGTTMFWGSQRNPQSFGGYAAFSSVSSASSSSSGASGGGDACTTIGNWKNVWATHTHGTPVLESSSWPTLETGTSSSGQFSDSSSQTGSSTTALPAAGMGSGNLSQSGSGYWSNDALNTNGSSHACGSQLSSGWTPSSIQSIDTEEQHGPNWQPGGVGGGRGSSSGSVGSDTMNIVPSLPLLSRRPKHEVPLNWAQENGPGSCRSGAQGGDGPTSLVPSSGWAIRTNGSSCFRKDLSADLPSVSEGKLSEELESNSAWEVQRLNYSCSGGKWGNAELIGICESPDDEPLGLESCTDTSNGISRGTKSGNGQQHSRVDGSDEAKEVWDGVSAQEVVKESSWGGDECMAPSVGSNESTSTGGGGGSSSNGGSGSRNCSFYRWTEHSSRTDAKTIILNVMSRTDLDPRVLSHTGWGQTPVRQDTTWDVDSLQGPGERRDCRLNGGSGEKIFAGGSNASPGVSEHGRSCKVGQTGPRFGNKGNDEQISSFSSQKNKNREDSRTSEQRSWGNWSNNSALSWGDNQVPCSWGDTAPRNRDGWWASHNSSDSSASQNWSQDSEMSKVSSWTESPALKACDGYENLGKARKLPQGQWTDIAGEKPQINGWEGDRVARSVSHNCSKPMPKVETTSSGVSSSWRDPGEGRPGIEVWNGDGGSPPASKLGTAVWGEPPSDGLEHTDNQEQPQSSGRCQDHERNGQCSSAGWVGGPMPSTEAESSGWEEPPLQSLQRRTEVDDGTAAWGDPTLHRNHSVNLWDGSRVGRVELQSSDRPSRKISALAQGWRDHPKVADNGVSAWGKPVELPENWSDTGDVNGTAVWSASVTTEASGKRGKSMQDGWPGGAEERMPQCRGWEDENDIGIWNHSAAIQDRARHNRRLPHKGNMGKSPYRPDDVLIDRLIKQLTDQGFRRESAEEALRGNHLNLEMALGVLQKAEFERHGLSSALDLNGLLPRSNLLREPPLDRNPFFDKNGNQGTFARNLPPQQLSPGQPFPPSQSSLRSQVPPHFIGPQVAPAQLLQYAAKAGGLNPALLLQAPLASPQIAVFNQLAQLQLTQQRLLMQQQQQQQNLSQQSQRNPPVLRHQQEQIIRTINNLQQQQQRLAPFLPGKGHHGCNPKSVTTSQCPGFTDPSSKAQKSTSYQCYSHGLADGVADCHGSEIKDKGQSRLTQWTLGPNVDGLAMDHSHGSLVAGLGKLSLDDPFHHYQVLPGGESLVSPTLPLANGWSSSKSSSSEKLSSGSASLNWPPEFHPGEPWKGLPQIDPESDPDITPGSVSFLRDRNPGVSPSSSPISTTLPSSSAWPPSASSNGYHNGYTPTYSTTGKLSEPKSSWASDTQLQGHLGNDMWQVTLPPGKSSHGPSRPPPGLASLKTPLPWIGGSRWGDQEHGHIPAAMNWSKDCASSGRASTWLVLRNLTPQIDGSTLRTLCMQHGPLITFHLSLAHGNALVCYSSREEAGKAQKSLHMCVLGNTTILAEFASDDEINRFFSQPGANLNNSGWPLPTPVHTRPTTAPSVHESSGTGGLFSPSGQWTDTEGSLLWSMPHFSSTRSPSSLPSSSARLWQCTTGNEVRRGRLPSPPPPLNNFLPGDLLGGESM